MALSREEIASRYGKALFEYSSDAGVLDDVHQEMNVLLEVAEQNPNLIKVLSDPVLRKNEKEEIFDAFTTGVSVESKNFLQYLLSYQRFGNLIDIIDNFNNRYNKSQNIADGKATTAIALQQEELDKMGQAYAKKYGLSALNLKNEVDPDILGGVILQVGDKLIDGSIKTKLQQIREQLIEN